MSFLGDLLYPDNPVKRTAINKLQTDISNANNQLINSVNNYNNQYQVVKKVILSNYFLQAAAISLAIEKQPLPVKMKDDIQNYSDPVMVTVMDFLLAFGISTVAVPYFAKSAWAYGKLNLKSLTVNDVRSLASEIGAAMETQFVQLIQTMLPASLLRMLEAPEAAAYGRGMAMQMSVLRVDGSIEPAVANMQAQVDSADEAINLMSEASSALKTSAGVVVITLGLDLILDAISGARERSYLESSLKTLEGSEDKLKKSQAAIDKSQEILDSTRANAEASFKKIYQAFSVLNTSLAEASSVLAKPIPAVSDFNDLDQVMQAQAYLADHFQDIVPFVSVFKTLIENKTLKESDFSDVESAPESVITLLSSEHNKPVVEIKALMVWFNTEYLSNKPENSAVNKDKQEKAPEPVA